MELRQLRYFAKVVECGSMGRAATELGVVTSALSQQISRLESELSTRLLTRTAAGILRRRGYGDDRLRFVEDRKGTHHESSWRRRLPVALRFFYR